MRFNQNFIRSSSKMMIIAGLAIGITGSVFAGGTSIVNNLNNQVLMGNAQNKVQSDHHTTGGDGGNGGHTTGGTTGGGTGCVPEPASMLALGIGAGVMAL